MRVSWVALGLLGLVGSACGGSGDRASEASPSATAAPSAPSPGSLDFGAAAEVATGLEVPWALAFVDDATILVTERGGRVRVVRGGRLEPTAVATVSVSARGEGGLLGLALHPEFPKQRVAYLYYTAERGNRIARYDVGQDLTLSNERVLLDRIPSAQFHNGGGLAFGPDGMLYAATGDAREPRIAADPASLGGKILRINPDGSIPDGNPFPNSPVYSFGHRNPQGMGWTSDGTMYAAEHGPTGEGGLCCRDEINRIEPGAFYGWPFRAGSGSGPERGSPPAQPVDPIAESGGDQTWAPSGLAVHERDGAVTLLVAALRGERLLRITIEGDRGTVGSVMQDHGRLRAATMGPGGCLFLTTSNVDGRGEPRRGDDRILRVCPSEG